MRSLRRESFNGNSDEPGREVKCRVYEIKGRGRAPSWATSAAGWLRPANSRSQMPMAGSCSKVSLAENTFVPDAPVICGEPAECASKSDTSASCMNQAACPITESMNCSASSFTKAATKSEPALVASGAICKKCGVVISGFPLQHGPDGTVFIRRLLEQAGGQQFQLSEQLVGKLAPAKTPDNTDVLVDTEKMGFTGTLPEYAGVRMSTTKARVANTSCNHFLHHQRRYEVDQQCACRELLRCAVPPLSSTTSQTMPIRE
ncbi:hypothetical protein FPV67DRAFT_1459387 [Lyophyllum atratum]|nr:hypothetical protein FPV67DRAFT_1459387 [Lyophyllum atratum]